MPGTHVFKDELANGACRELTARPQVRPVWGPARRSKEKYGY